MGPQVNILAFGNSLFAGYGVDKADSYPAKLEAAMRGDHERGEQQAEADAVRLQAAIDAKAAAADAASPKSHRSLGKASPLKNFPPR